MRLIIYIFLSALFFASCSPSQEEKDRVLNEFYQPGFYLEDTIINYTLDTNNLILEFAKPTRFQTWTILVYLNNKLTHHGIELFYNKETKVIDNKIIISDLSLSKDSLLFYEIDLRAFPNDKNIYFPVDGDDIKIRFLRSDTTKNILYSTNKNREYVKINFHAINNVDKEIQDYCLKKFQKLLENAPNFPEGVIEIK